jgi:phosphohistidine swiveling domain-containing protein
MPPRCLTLSDPAARDPRVVGAKAAGLAAAEAAGLPTLPGVVVPVAESAPVVRAAAKALDDGVTKARLAAMTVRPDDGLLAELADRTRPYPHPLIVRSSSPLEADGTWSGAFSSFHGVLETDLGTAVRGCWGSAFQVGVLERARHAGVDPEQLGLAVLVQPELAPEIGGTARCHADGTVQVTATRGPLQPLLAGHVEGLTATVPAADGAADGAAADAIAGSTEIPRELLLEVAALSRRVQQRLDHQLIEWAAADGRVHLLQSLRSPDLPPRLRVCPTQVEQTRKVGVDGWDRRATSVGQGVALRIAGLTQRFPGRLGYELVLPWAIASETLDRTPDSPPSTDPISLLAATRVLAAELTSWVWQRPPRAAAAESDRVLRQLRGDRPEAALAIVRELPPPTPHVAGRLLAHLDRLRDLAADHGVVDADSFWRLDPDGLDRAFRTGTAPTPSRLGIDLWEPYAHRVVMATGDVVPGTPAAPGIGVGRPYAFDPTGRLPLPSGRTVLVADRPDPALAPLLWNAAGLVTRAGGTAAHLLEFARSIGVPTVVGCELPGPPRPAGLPMVAVDGNRGRVAVAWAP